MHSDDFKPMLGTTWRATAPSDEPREVCRFTVHMPDGRTIVWDNLTRVQARHMYLCTALSQPSGVRSFGWGTHDE